MAHAAAKVGGIGRGFLGKLRSIASRRASSAEAPTKETATGYRTFSRKLAPGLTFVGGALAVIGGLGAWIRTSQMTVEGFTEEEVGVVMGHTSDWGRVIAVLGVLTAVSALAWIIGKLYLKIASVLFSLAVVVLAAWRLPLINEQAASFADQARSGEASFVVFHAGYGWGSWCLIAAAVVLFLATTIGILRELDLRRGIEG